MSGALIFKLEPAPMCVGGFFYHIHWSNLPSPNIYFLKVLSSLGDHWPTIYMLDPALVHLTLGGGAGKDDVDIQYSSSFNTSPDMTTTVPPAILHNSTCCIFPAHSKP